MARNVINVDELKEQLEYLVTDELETEIYSQDLEDTLDYNNLSARVEPWVMSVLRNYLLAEAPTKEVKRLPKNCPQWMRDAKARGDQLVAIEFGKVQWDNLTKLTLFVAQMECSDLKRVSVPQARQAMIEHEKKLKEEQRKREEAVKATQGRNHVCTFNDGLVVHQLITSDSCRKEAQDMHNCLAGYANDVQRDNYRVFSFRMKDKPVIDLGLRVDGYNGKKKLRFDQIKASHNRTVPKEYHDHVKMLIERIGQQIKIDSVPTAYKKGTATKAKATVNHQVVAIDKAPTVIEGNLVINNTDISHIDSVKVKGGVYARRSKLVSLPVGEYHGNVDISYSQVDQLPENSVFHGNVYAYGRQLKVPQTTVVKGQIIC